MDYVKQLNEQAEWCLAMAKQTTSFELFHRYHDVAAACLRRARDIADGRRADWTPIAPTDPRLVFGPGHNVSAFRL